MSLAKLDTLLNEAEQIADTTVGEPVCPAPLADLPGGNEGLMNEVEREVTGPDDRGLPFNPWGAVERPDGVEQAPMYGLGEVGRGGGEGGGRGARRPRVAENHDGEGKGSAVFGSPWGAAPARPDGVEQAPSYGLGKSGGRSARRPQAAEKNDGEGGDMGGCTLDSGTNGGSLKNGAGGSPKRRGPRMLVCYLCGTQHGLSSITIHQGQCEIKRQKAQAVLAPEERTDPPAPPAMLLPGPKATMREVEEYNAAAQAAYDKGAARHTQLRGEENE